MQAYYQTSLYFEVAKFAEDVIVAKGSKNLRFDVIPLNWTLNHQHFNLSLTLYYLV